MNKNDTETLRQNIDSVLAAAEEFNKQSKQLENAKVSFAEHSERIQALSTELGNIAKACEDLVNTTNQLISENEKTAKAITDREEVLPGKIDEVKASVKSLTSTTSELAGAVNNLADNYTPLEKKVETAIWDSTALQKKVEVVLDDIGNLRKTINEYNSDISSLEQKVQKAIDDTTLINKADKLANNIDALDSKISNMQKTVNTSVTFAVLATLSSLAILVLSYLHLLP